MKERVIYLKLKDDSKEEFIKFIILLFEFIPTVDFDPVFGDINPAYLNTQVYRGHKDEFKKSYLEENYEKFINGKNLDGFIMKIISKDDGEVVQCYFDTNLFDSAKSISLAEAIVLLSFINFKIKK